MWIDHLHEGSVKERLQYCLNSGGFIHYMRAIQSLPENVEIPYHWNDDIHHVASSLDLHSLCIDNISHYESSVSLQGILVHVKSDKLVHCQQVNWYPGTQNNKSNYMRIDLKHVETHEYINQ